MKADMPEGFKETEIGMIPEHWEVVRLGDVAEQRKESIAPENNGKTKYIGLEHIDTGDIRLHRHGYYTEVRSSKFRFYIGDILYGKLRPYLDKCILADFEGICSTDIIVLKTNNKIDKSYLAYMMHLEAFLEHAIKTTTGVNHPRTSWGALTKFNIPLPNEQEQQQIAETLSAIDDKIQAEQTKMNALDALFKSLLSQLMTGKIRVKDLEI